MADGKRKRNLWQVGMHPDIDWGLIEKIVTSEQNGDGKKTKLPQGHRAHREKNEKFITRNYIPRGSPKGRDTSARDGVKRNPGNWRTPLYPTLKGLK